jgi:hypothetical protein
MAASRASHELSEVEDGAFSGHGALPDSESVLAAPSLQEEDDSQDGE